MTEDIHPEGAILNAALELPADARAAYLNKACAGDAALRRRVEGLLQAHEQAEGFLEAPPSGLETDRGVTAVVPPFEKAGDCIGPYKLLQQIGEGGCGVVYMAEQKAPILRRVALKVIKPGMDTKQVIARFDAERQALALMDHPNIAKVLEAGATESGRPYFVMELVRGVKITDFCDEQNLSTEERLRLFTQVCQAVQHAHQKGVIHRDIKPSNILVTINDGVPVPKVIDFGIAKATQGRLTDQTVFTAFEQFIGTPAYMSPEQAVLTSLDVDTRSDIYSLGVLLYELLTGSTPFDQKELLAAGMDEMRRTIGEKEPPKPSTRLSSMAADALTTTAKRRRTDAPKLIHLVRGDLDWIVMTCVEKDRARRYETANGLARDIERHLGNEPVTARPAGVVYRVRKFCRRNKVVVTAGAAVAAVLALGACASTWEAIRAWQAGREQIRLRKEAQASEQRALSAQKNEAQQRERAEAQAYAADISLAGQALANDNLRQALELLRKHIPRPGEPDLRGFEWRYLWRECRSQELFSLPGHPIWDGALAFSPDGRTLATGNDDKSAKLWDVSSRREIATLTDTNPILRISFSHDGELLATASWISVRIWETKHFQLIRVLPDAAWRAAFSPVSHYLATGSSNNSVLLWDTASWRVVRKVGGGGDPDKSHLAFSPDGRRLAVAWKDGIRLFHVPDFQSSGQLQDEQPHDFAFVAFSPDGHTLAAATLPDKELKLWSLDNLRPIRVLSGHMDSIYGAAFSPDGKRLATCSSDETVRIWDPDTGEVIRTFRGHEQEVHEVAFSPDGKLLASCSVDGGVKLWDARAVPVQSTQLTEGSCLGFDTQGSLIIASKAASPETLKAFEPESLGPLGTLDLHGGKPGHYGRIPGSLLSDGKTVVLPWTDQSNSHSYVLFDLDRGQFLGSAGTFLTNRFMYFAAAPNSRLLAAAGTNHTVSVWQWPEGVRKCVLTNTTEPLAFSPDGTMLVTDSDPKESESGREEIKLWNLQGECLRQFDTPDFYMAGGFSPDGKVLALGTGIITLRAVPSCQPVGRLVGHTRLGLDLSFSPDGSTLASVTDDCTVRLWHMATGRQLLVLSIPQVSGLGFRRVLFSPDSRTLVVSGCDVGGEAFTRVWHAPSFAEIAVAEGKDYAPLATDTATWLVTAKALEKANRPEEAVRAFTEVIRRSGDLGPLRSALLHRARLQRRLGQNVEDAADHPAALELPARDRPINATNALATFYRWALYDLSMNYEDADYLDEALPLFEASWEHIKDKLGAENPLAIAVQNDLGWVYLQAGQTNKAVTLFEDALKLAKAKFGFTEPTIDIIRSLGEAYHKAGRGEEALRLIEDSFKLWKDKLGPDHPDTVGLMNVVGIEYSRGGRSDKALQVWEDCYQRFAKIKRKAARTTYNLAHAYSRAGRNSEAQCILDCILTPDFASSSQSKDLLWMRARLLARQAKWEGAAADLARIIDFDSEDPMAWHSLAVLMAQTGEVDRYREHCRKSLKQFENTKDPDTAERIAKDCLILPSSGADLQAVARLASFAASTPTNHSDWAWREFCKGLSEYRVGHFAEAVERAQSALSQAGTSYDQHVEVTNPWEWGPGNDSQAGTTDELAVEAEAMLAMAQWQLRQTDAARKELAKAAEVAATKLPKLESGDLGCGWMDWIYAHALLREAKDLIEGTPVATAAPK